MKWAATLAVAAAVVGLTSGECTSTGFTCVGGQCLAFFTSYGTWFNQRSTCTVIENADLAKVTGDLHSAVYQYITEATDSDLDDECIWIGGSDQDFEAHWTWVYDGEEIPLGGPQWHPCEDEPNGGNVENYLTMCPDDDYYFSDYPSTKEFHAICQKFDETC